MKTVHAETNTSRPQRWCLYIDILGFSKLWECESLKAYRSLRELMKGAYLIGTKVYPRAGERLFVHHMGDGLAIVGDFGEDSLDRPLSIATALMRCVVSTETFASAAIAEGEFADISSCYPQEILAGAGNSRVVPLGEGCMTLSSVMGTAFIRAYRLHETAPPGPHLAVPKHFHSRIPPDYILPGDEKMESLSIDWIRFKNSTLTEIQEVCEFWKPEPNELMQAIYNYTVRYPEIREKWLNLSRDLLYAEAE